MKNAKVRGGFTLVEILIVVVIMAVLAATIIPQFSDSTKDAKISSVKFNLQTLRQQIQLYKSQHDGKLPSASLTELTSKTNVGGSVGTGALFPYGPYVKDIPTNAFTNSKTIKTITNDPAVSGDVTTTDGWLYNATTGALFINDATLLSE